MGKKDVGEKDLLTGMAQLSNGGIRAYPPFVDVMDFARRGQEIVGEFGIHRLVRLLDGLPDQPDCSVVRYAVKGHSGPDGHPRLKLGVRATVVLECQRCLGDLQWPIDHEAVFEIVRHESDFDADELEYDETDQVEKILGSPKFDLGELVEDELILEIPYVPKHDNCANGTMVKDGTDQNDSQASERPSPFAVLGQLKKSK